MQQQYNDKSDVFSIGILLLGLVGAIHGKGDPLQPIKSKQDYESRKDYLMKLNESSIVKNSENPNELSQMLRGVLAWQNSQRSSLEDIASNRWLNDKPILTVKYL